MNVVRILKHAVTFMASNLVFWGVVMIYILFLRTPAKAGEDPIYDCTFAPDDKGYAHALNLSSDQCALVNYRHGFMNIVMTYGDMRIVRGTRLDSEHAVSILSYAAPFRTSKGAVDVDQADLLWQVGLVAMYDDGQSLVQSFIGADGERVFVTWIDNVVRAHRLYAKKLQITYHYDRTLDDPVSVDWNILTFLDKTIKK